TVAPNIGRNWAITPLACEFPVFAGCNDWQTKLKRARDKFGCKARKIGRERRRKAQRFTADRMGEAQNRSVQCLPVQRAKRCLGRGGQGVDLGGEPRTIKRV